MQMHLDLYVPRSEVEDACAEAISAGASLVQEAADPQADAGFVVLSDPAGHPFCICWNNDAQ